MITLRVYMAQKQCCGFALRGHAGAGKKGQDIVCAAVSSAAYLAANTLSEFADIAQAAQGENSLRVLAAGQTEVSKAVLQGFLQHMRALAAQYPKNIRIIYERNQNNAEN